MPDEPMPDRVTFVMEQPSRIKVRRCTDPDCGDDQPGVVHGHFVATEIGDVTYRLVDS